jgi:putative ABC transport system substrate-binding protein
MKRRLWLAAAGATYVAAVSRASAQPKIPRIGFLIAGEPEPGWSFFKKGMAQQGLVEGSTVQYEYRTARPSERDRLAEHAASLVQANVDIIVAILTPAINAARQATAKIPIVFFGSDVDSGLVRNLARPEGNITGLFGTSAAYKGFQLLREIRPAIKSVGVLVNIPDPFHQIMRRDYTAAGREQKLEYIEAAIEKPADLAPAMERLAAQGVEAVAVQPSLPLPQVAALALKHRLISMSSRRGFVEAGGLISYGSDQAASYLEIARYVGRLLKGAAVGDLPAQLPTKLELAVNVKTAREIGVTFSPMFLGRVDEVLE